jgi:hypothetical protein
MNILARMAAAAAVISFALLPVIADSAQASPGHEAPAPAAITWSVSPAAAKGKDDRVAFAYSVNPGVEITDYVAVSNLGAKPTTFNVYATDATNDYRTGAFSLLPSAQKPVDLGSWIKLPVSKILVAPGTQARIPVTILVPSDASPGDHTAGIIASIVKTTKGAHGSTIRLEERVGARVYLHVIGKEVAQATTTGLTSSFSPSFNPFGAGQASVNYAVKNTGNVRVDVTQRLTIAGPFGIVLGHLTGPRIRNILPGESVQEKFADGGVPPLLLLWSTVKLTTAAPTDTIAAGTTRNASGAPAAPVAAPKPAETSNNSVTGAIPWTLLVLILVVAAGIWLLVRYVGASRDRVYLAIDAAAGRAREKTLAETGQDDESTERRLDDARTKEPVA